MTKICLSVRDFFNRIKLLFSTAKRIHKAEKSQHRIFYLGVPAHANLGDLAQGVCIRHWLKKHYSNYTVVEIETNALVNTPFSLLKMLKSSYRDSDFIVFQSGYTTTDLGGYADQMHRAVMQCLPDASMLMLPQTIFFQKKENQEITASVYNSMKHMLFLARDAVSYETAKTMFPSLPIQLYPDIVTTMIGTFAFEYPRKGICFCCRNDEEKFYSDEDLAILEEQCGQIDTVIRTDTTKTHRKNNIVKNAEDFIKSEIDSYAHYRVMITDRYHGTILSLAACTPVIILKTTDHKVITGAKWFSGVYDDYVYTADSLEEAYQLVKNVLNKPLQYRLKPHFEEKFYDKLPQIFEESIERSL